MTETRWSSRKFWAAMVWQVAFTVMLYLNKLPPDVYEKLTWITLGVYFAANVADKFANKVGG